VVSITRLLNLRARRDGPAPAPRAGARPQAAVIPDAPPPEPAESPREKRVAQLRGAGGSGMTLAMRAREEAAAKREEEDAGRAGAWW
jgi:hypothetical protein